VLLDRLDADAEIIGDLLVEAAGDHPFHDIALPGGQASRRPWISASQTFSLRRRAAT
jgi:hypothetical protein